MTVMGLVFLIIVVVVLGLLAYWIINRFMPEPVRMPALAIVGVILLLVVLSAFFPNVTGIRIW